MLTEFPAVLLNLSTDQIESEFRQFVCPTNHPKLSPFCLQLTGITQQQVDQAQQFPEVFRAFKQWLDDITARKQLVFYTKENLGRSIGQNATFCTWASFDLRHYFQLEMNNHRLIRPNSMAVWVDFEVEYKVSRIWKCVFSPFINKIIFFFSQLEKVWRIPEIQKCIAADGHSTSRSCSFRYRGCTRLGQTGCETCASWNDLIHISNTIKKFL